MATVRPLTIFMVTNNYTPYSGGVVSSLTTSTLQLRALGHTVIIVTLDFLGQQISEEGVIRIPCPLRFSYKNNPMAVPIGAQWHILKLIHHYAPDIIHVHHPFLLCTSAVRAACREKIPVVFTHHTRYDQYVHYVPLPKQFTKPIVKKWVAHFCSKVTGLIAPSESIKHLVKAQTVSQHLAVIPSGIMPVYILPQFTYKPTKGKQLELLSVSRFVPEKNIPFLLNACTYLTVPFRLTLIGFGQETEALKDYAYTKLAFSPDHVQFIIKPPRTSIADWYRRADIFIFASTTETQGLVLAEAMASGTPVIAVNGTGVCDIVQEGINGFLVSSPHDMAQKIEHVAESPELFKILQKNAWNTARDYYPEKTAQRLVEFYYTLRSPIR